jgi:hypothetical protein
MDTNGHEEGNHGFHRWTRIVGHESAWRTRHKPLIKQALSRLVGFVRGAFAPLGKLTGLVVSEMLGPCSPIGVEDRLRRDRRDLY